jgi:hypothetical protein
MKKDSALKLDQQIARIEETIDALLARIDISKLTGVQCLRLFPSIMGLYLRTLDTMHKFEKDDPGDREKPLIEELMRRMREPTSKVSDPEATRVVDSQLDVKGDEND